MQAAPAVALVLALVACAGPAGAQSRFFDHQANRWETLEPGLSPRDVIEAPGGVVPPGRGFSAFPEDAAPPPARVVLHTNEAPGTVIVDTGRRVLYLVERGGTATRYPIGVGREGFGFAGTVRVGQKAEWPDWLPPAEMRAREAARGHYLPERVAGGADNPLGARALYLYRGGRDTLFRIHGTNQPWTVGKRSSSGCIRMRNEDVEALYARVPTGARVVVIGPNGGGRAGVYREGPA